MSPNLVRFAPSRASGPLVALLLLLVLAAPCLAQPEPALRSAVEELVTGYLKTGPSKKELSDGSANANWALVEKVALPEFLLQESLGKGDWSKIWAPVSTLLEERGFAGLGALSAISLWEQTRSRPPRFLRLLGKKGLIDPKKPKERKRAKELQEMIGPTVRKLPLLRSSIRFEKAGWKYTGTATMAPGRRIVRLALRGSQPCKISGRARTINLALKGRLHDDPGSAKGFKVEVLDTKFQSRACQLDMVSRLNSVVALAQGGETRVAGSLTLQLKDKSVSGRLQLDLVSRQAGKPLLTGRAIYKVRGEMNDRGGISAKLVPLSASGNKVLREGLEQPGSLTGLIMERRGSGKIELPLCAELLTWKAKVREPRVP